MSKEILEVSVLLTVFTPYLHIGYSPRDLDVRTKLVSSFINVDNICHLKTHYKILVFHSLQDDGYFNTTSSDYISFPMSWTLNYKTQFYVRDDTHSTYYDLHSQRDLKLKEWITSPT